MKKKEVFYLICVIILYLIGISYVAFHNLSFEAIFKYGLLQPKGIMGLDARIVDIDTPLSWNLLSVAWFIIIKGSAVLVELTPYWLIGMLIAGALVVWVSWEDVRKRMGQGGFGANFLATTAGAIIPICSCGIVPVLIGMVEAGVPLGPTLAFLVSAPMLNVPTVFMTAGVLGWKMAVARIIAVFVIAMAVGLSVSFWLKKYPGLNLVKIYIPPKLSPELQQFTYQLGMKLAVAPQGLSIQEIGIEHKGKLLELEEMGLLEQNEKGKYQLAERDLTSRQNACFILPTGSKELSFGQKVMETLKKGWELFIQLNYYFVMAVLIAGAIKVLIPTNLIVNWVGGKALNSVLISSIIAILAYICTYVEVPTALALISKGMGGGATLAYLLGGPGLSLPSIMMLSSVFRKRLLALYVGLSFLGCVIAGYIFNLF